MEDSKKEKTVKPNRQRYFHMRITLRVLPKIKFKGTAH